MKNWFANTGPATLVAAAFVGPGTVTVCTLTGVNDGYSLLWAIALSIIVCMILQEMSLRLGLVTRMGLSEVLKSQFNNAIARALALGIILSAIAIGNAAYEAGNISGAVLGLETIFARPVIGLGTLGVNPLSLLIGAIAFIMLYLGNYRLLEICFIGLVILMSLAFISVAVVTRPDFTVLLQGFVPRFHAGQALTVISLIGTTVVPYNLFLHTTLVTEKWHSVDDLSAARRDMYLSITLGGLISLSIVIAGAAVNATDISSAADLALGLEPVFGAAAKYLLSLGLFAAGITSAVTAPLAAAYVARGCLAWNEDIKGRRFRAVWMFILLTGIIFSSLGIKPIDVIRFAQFANGLLLPLVAGFLLWAMNRRQLLGDYVNSRRQNLLGLISLLIVILLGIRGVWLAVIN